MDILTRSKQYKIHGFKLSLKINIKKKLAFKQILISKFLLKSLILVIYFNYYPIKNQTYQDIYPCNIHHVPSHHQVLVLFYPLQDYHLNE